MIVCCCRNASLKQRVKELKKKEAEETKALEEMVLKVESNLETTTVSVFMLSVFTLVRDLSQDLTERDEMREGE